MKKTTKLAHRHTVRSIERMILPALQAHPETKLTSIRFGNYGADTAYYDYIADEVTGGRKMRSTLCLRGAIDLAVKTKAFSEKELQLLESGFEGWSLTETFATYGTDPVKNSEETLTKKLKRYLYLRKIGQKIAEKHSAR
jgi:hypothetical protein